MRQILATLPAPLASVVFTTYEQPDWLEKVLWGFEAQTVRAFEVIVADDGSGEETRRRIEALQPRLRYPLRHVWQPHEGFRKCRILNQAIVASASDYLVFTDGDCIPRADFLDVHLRHRTPGRFLSGGYVKLPMPLSEAISREDILAGRCFELRWLRAHGLPLTSNYLKLGAGERAGAWLDRLTPAGATWNGHNASGWKRDILAVNGYDERLQYGGLDRELGERLTNLGVRGKQLRHRAVVIHLDHARGYRTPESIARNMEIRRQVRRGRLTWATNGISPGAPPAAR